jgi:hypothetical protein
MQVVRERQLEAVAARHYEERAPGRLVRQWFTETKNAKLQRLCVGGGGGAAVAWGALRLPLLTGDPRQFGKRAYAAPTERVVCGLALRHGGGTWDRVSLGVS